MTLETNLVAWSAPKGAVHSLEHLSQLSGARSVLLCVSERTMYVLQNLAALDVTFRARYARLETDAGFIPVSEQDAEWVEFLAVVENLQLEVYDMSCDVVNALAAITSQLESCCAIQTAILRSIATGANGPAIDGYIGDGHPYYDPPSSNTSNPGGTAFCQRAWSFALDWSEANAEARDQASALGQGGIGLITLIFAAIDLPLAVLVGLLLEIAEVIILLDADVYRDILDESMEGLACAIYSSSSSSTAVFNARAYIDTIPELNQRTRDALASQCCNSVMTAIFGGTYPIRAGAPSDCSACPGECEDLVLSSLVVPYNVLICGVLESFDQTSEDWGWSSKLGGDRLHIEFAAPSNIADVQLTFYCGNTSPPGLIDVGIYRMPDLLPIVVDDDLPVLEGPPGTDQYTRDWTGVNLVAGTTYSLRFSKPQQSGESNWINRIVLSIS